MSDETSNRLRRAVDKLSSDLIDLILPIARAVVREEMEIAASALLPAPPRTLQDVHAIKRSTVAAAMDRNNGNISAAARELGIERSSLQRMLSDRPFAMPVPRPLSDAPAESAGPVAKTADKEPDPVGEPLSADDIDTTALSEPFPVPVPLTVADIRTITQRLQAANPPLSEVVARREDAGLPVDEPVRRNSRGRIITKQACRVCGEFGHNARRHKFRGDEDAGSGQPGARATQEVADTPGQDESPAAGNVADPQSTPGNVPAVDTSPPRSFQELSPADTWRRAAADPREVCPVHGWVGGLEFHRSRHDLCESPPEPDADDTEEHDPVDLAVLAPRAVSIGRSSERRRNPQQPRAETLSVRIMRQAIGIVDAEPEDMGDVAEFGTRPRTRSECVGGERPCPWVSCRHHLYLDVNEETGAIKFNFPDQDPWELRDSCSLDIADSGEKTLEEVGQHMNVTRERTRQLEQIGMQKLKSTRLVRSVEPGDLGRDLDEPIM